MFDLTEAATHHFVAAGLVVHNCSEYMFLDDTACNLASINLVKFLREDGSFDVEGFRHACRLWTIVLEISVLMGSYPSAPIAQRSWDFRTLGLGYANMGTVLMRKGIPYDSRQAAAICGAITAIMSGEAYATSAEMARDLGAVPRLPEEPRRDAARDAQPPPRRLQRRAGGVRGPHDHAARRRRAGVPARAACPRRARRGIAPSRSARRTATATPR